MVILDYATSSPEHFPWLGLGIGEIALGSAGAFFVLIGYWSLFIYASPDKYIGCNTSTVDWSSIIEYNNWTNNKTIFLALLGVRTWQERKNK